PLPISAIPRCGAVDVRRLRGPAVHRLQRRGLSLRRVLSLHTGVHSCRACAPHAFGLWVPRAGVEHGFILPGSFHADEPRFLVEVTSRILREVESWSHLRFAASPCSLRSGRALNPARPSGPRTAGTSPISILRPLRGPTTPRGSKRN